jgi:hypothetical protein
MSFYPTNDTYVDTWIRNTCRILKSAPLTILQSVFGPRIAEIDMYDYNERTYAEAFYGDFHHPESEFAPYITQLMNRLPLAYLLQFIGNAGSYRSWMDLRQLVRHPEFSSSTMAYLEEMSQQTVPPNTPLHDLIVLTDAIPTKQIMDELHNLLNNSH